MVAIPFNQNVWFKFSATSMQYRMEQHFRNIYPNFRKLSSGSFLSAFKFAPECLNFWLKGSHFGNVSGSLGTFPGKYCTNCRCFQSLLSFGWIESAQMHPRNLGSERIVRTYYDVQKSVPHVQIRPIDLSIIYLFFYFIYSSNS